MYYRINYLSTTRVDMDGSCVMGVGERLRTVAVARVWLAHRPTPCNAPLIAIEAPRQQQAASRSTQKRHAVPCHSCGRAKPSPAQLAPSR